MSYIISWSENSGKILIDDTLFTIFDKPELPFDFDALYYEVPTSLFIKVLNNITLNLTEEEKAACVKYCVEFKESDDFPVVAIDPSYNVFMGIMSRKQAKDRGYTILEDIAAPTFTPAILENGEWVKIVKAITTSGKLVIEVSANTSSYAILFTEKTWGSFKKPSYYDMTYDFISESWIDSRSFSSVLDKAANQIRSEAIIEMGDFDLLKSPVDPVLYLYQYDEMCRYLEDENASTPFIDAVIESTGYDKKEFVNRILNKYNEERLHDLGLIHGKCIKNLDALSTCSTVADIDNLMASITFKYTPSWRVAVD